MVYMHKRRRKKIRCLLSNYTLKNKQNEKILKKNLPYTLFRRYFFKQSQEASKTTNLKQQKQRNDKQHMKENVD